MQTFLQYLICEDRESKNMHKARKWIETNHPEVIGLKLLNGVTITPLKLIEEIRNTIPSSRLADCKFLVGVTRLYFDNQTNSEIQSVFNKLNKILKILATAHANEYDENLNGLSFEELDRKFSSAVQKELSSDKEEIDKLVLIKKEDYQIVPIDSFEEAKKYGKYTSWCVTHQKNMYDSYTKNGLGRFYFCLKPGFEKVPKTEGDGCPMDDYGKSMIAISVNDDGSLNTCTCRWNHDNGGDDNMMDTKEISEFFGVNFYKTFVPYSGEQLLAKYKKQQKPDNAISRALGAIHIYDEEIERHVYVKVVDGKIVKCHGISENTILKDGKFYHVSDGKIYKGAPREVGGNFYCSNTQITSLEGAPKEVGGNFWCSSTKITSLNGAPEKVGGNFSCSSTKITSLNGAPEKVGGSFLCDNTQITSLEGAPREVGGNFYCSYTNITSLEGAPEKVGGSFSCSSTKITSLNGAPVKVGRDFYCSYTNITSLEGAPVKVGGDFYCDDTRITSLEGAPEKVGGSFWCDRINITSLEGAPVKVGGSFSCSSTKITSLNGAPSKVGRDFYCYNTKITSLNGAPEKVGGNFNCSHTQITSLNGAPEKVGGGFYCNDTQITSLEGAPKEVGGSFSCNNTQITRDQLDAYKAFLKNPTPEHIDETGHYKP